jgi:hypothetical protein
MLIRSIGSICTATFSGIMHLPKTYGSDDKIDNRRLTDCRQFDRSLL